MTNIDIVNERELTDAELESVTGADLTLKKAGYTAAGVLIGGLVGLGLGGVGYAIPVPGAGPASQAVGVVAGAIAGGYVGYEEGSK